MPTTVHRLLVVCALLLPWSLSAQDKIYSASEITSCHVTDITTTTVTYLPLKSSKSVTVYVKKILFLFNERGLFLQPSKMDFRLKETQQLVEKFLHDEGMDLPGDRIYKNDKMVLDVRISNEDKAFVYLQDNKKIDKKSIAAIVYKDGSHQVFGAPTKAADVLWAAQQNNSNPNAQSPPVVKKETSARSAQTTVPEKVAATASSKATVEEKSTVIKTPGKQPEETSVKPIQENVDSSVPLAAPTKPKITDILDESLVDAFKVKSKGKATEFSNYLKIICDKKVDAEEQNKAIEQALKLFVNEDATIEVSSLNKPSVKHKIKAYLPHLKLLNYDKVELIWTNVQYVTDVKKGMDGNYYGAITFEQEFRGYRDNIMVYSDITIKKSVVILKTYEKFIDGNAVSMWDVLLGDIGVESTRSM